MTEAAESRAAEAQRIVDEMRELVRECSRESQKRAPGFLLGPELQRAHVLWVLCRRIAFDPEDAPNRFGLLVGCMFATLMAVIEEQHPFPGGAR